MRGAEEGAKKNHNRLDDVVAEAQGGEHADRAGGPVVGALS
jgi:hypothetical protein